MESKNKYRSASATEIHFKSRENNVKSNHKSKNQEFNRNTPSHIHVSLGSSHQAKEAAFLERTSQPWVLPTRHSPRGRSTTDYSCHSSDYSSGRAPRAPRMRKNLRGPEGPQNVLEFANCVSATYYSATENLMVHMYRLARSAGIQIHIQICIRHRDPFQKP